MVDTPGWQLRRLLAAPHRLCFFAGALMFALSGVWWAAALLARGFTWQVPPGMAHGWLMGGGFMPMFFAGFLFTAGPRWLQHPPVSALSLRVPVALHLVGWGLFMAGCHLSALAAAAGMALAATGYGLVSWRFGRMLHASRATDTLHARLLLAACAMGSGLLLMAAAGLATGRPQVAQAALHASLWAANALAFVSAVHRMLPFFGDAAPDAWVPEGTLRLLVAAVLVQALIAAAELLGGPLPIGLVGLQALGEAALAGLLLQLAWRSRRRPSPSLRLLAMLHLGFTWLGLAFALGAVSHAMRCWGDAAGLGLAPVHALSAGFMGSTLFAMVGRVSAGHSGRAVAADALLWRLFWLLQLAVASRVVAALWEAAAGVLLPAAALAWAVASTAWALRYGRWYGTPRADGREG
ncbi:NnrS family protein [Sphaerotilaceae bacterium SBD11-9]